MLPIHAKLKTLELQFGCSLDTECQFLEKELSHEDFKSKGDYLPATVMLHQLYNMAGIMHKAVRDSLALEMLLVNGECQLNEAIWSLKGHPNQNGILKSRTETEKKKEFFEGVVLGVTPSVISESISPVLSEFIHYLKECEKSLTVKLEDLKA